MPEKALDEYEGLIDRVLMGSKVGSILPDQLSDKEVEGLISLVPEHLAKTVRAFLAPQAREAGMTFLRASAEWNEELLRAREKGAKIILGPLPELLHCFENAYSLSSEALTTSSLLSLEGSGERYWDLLMGLGIPDFMCSAFSLAVGSMLTGSDFIPDAIILNTTGHCDANAKMHAFAAHCLDIPVFIFEKPADDSREGHELHVNNLNRLIAELEEFIGEELSEDRMRLVSERANRAAELFYDLRDLKKSVPCPAPNVLNIFVGALRFTMWGSEQAVEVMEKIVELTKSRRERGEYPAEKEIARCLWTYTLYYTDLVMLCNAMEEKGITLLGDMVGNLVVEPIDTSTRESMIEGLARNIRGMPMMRQMGAESMSGMWLEDIIYWARELGADCAIFAGHQGCKQSWSVFSLVRKELMKREGIPTLCLQGDCWNKRITPASALQEQIEEFVNIVVSKHR